MEARLGENEEHWVNFERKIFPTYSSTRPLAPDSSTEKKNGTFSFFFWGGGLFPQFDWGRNAWKQQQNSITLETPLKSSAIFAHHRQTKGTSEHERIMKGGSRFSAWEKEAEVITPRCEHFREWRAEAKWNDQKRKSVGVWGLFRRRGDKQWTQSV